MRKIFDTLFGIVSDAVHPREAGVAVLLGTLAGFVSGWNLSLVAVLLLVLVLRAPLKVFAEAWGLAAALSWALTPLTFRTGQYVLEQSNIGGWIAAEADGIWVVLFDLDRYTLVGGIVCGLVLSVPAAFAAAQLTRWLQVRFQKFQDLVTADGTWKAPLAVRVAYWMIFGSPAQAKPATKPRLIRRAGVAVAALVLLPAAALAWYFGPGLIERSVLASLAAANGADVDGSIELSFGEGLLLADGLQVADPDALDYDRLRIDRLTAVVKTGPLLRGQLIVDKVLLEGISSGEPRARRAHRVGLEIPRFGDVSVAPAGEADDAAGGAAADLPLEDYAADWQGWQERLERIQWLLDHVEQFGSSEPDEAADRIPAGYLALRAARCDFGRRRPRVQIGLLRARELPQQWGLGRGAVIHISDLSSDPKLTGRPTKVELQAPQHALQLAAQLNLHRAGVPHAVSLEARGIDLRKLVKSSGSSDGFTLDGRVDLVGSGWVTSRSLDVPLTIVARDVRVEVPAGRKIAGLTPDLWNHGLMQLRGFDLRGSLQGRWRRPRLQLATRDLARQFKQQLVAAGNLVLAQAVDEQIAQGRQAVESAVADRVADAHETIERGREQVDDAVAQGQERLTETDRYAQGQFDAADQRAEDARTLADRYTAQGAERLQDEIQRHTDEANDFFGETAGPAGDALPPGLAQQIINETSRQMQTRVGRAQQEADRYAESAGDRIQAGIDAARQRYEQTREYAEPGGEYAQQPLDGAQRYGDQWLEEARRSARRYGESLADPSRGGAAPLGAANASKSLPQSDRPAVEQGDYPTATPTDPIYVPEDQHLADRYPAAREQYVPMPRGAADQAALESQYQPVDPSDRSVLPPTDRLNSQYDGARRESPLYDSDWASSASAVATDTAWQQDPPAEVPAGGLTGRGGGGLPYPETTPRGAPAGFTERPDKVRLPFEASTAPRAAPPIQAAPPLPAQRPSMEPAEDSPAESEWAVIRWGKQVGRRVKRFWSDDEGQADALTQQEEYRRRASQGMFGAPPQRTARAPQRTGTAGFGGAQAPPEDQAPASESEPQERWYQKLQFWR